ncbi:diguanylate cyclase (GGDEF) domain-containing protein [Oryzisolibacter propanilivorax]|uniref:diguanylate cyclase n=1 Tax=Oryzisolibacter propanilivorax TaxID=1527607 RepID=A0A1G9PQ31_9BURK|nr:GGDEF domain-containing protein [Oryzisolibacter propanilivorax]SDM00890.1 diguanylate cyclase (GGDEF) domain-containing protein [Oryzisolibacter propanilivorax]
MKPLLQNLAEMTAHRDHLRLEVSVLSTLLQQGRMLEVRALELFTQSGEAWLRPRSWSQDGGELLSSPHEPSADPQAVPLASVPELAQCIAGKGRDAVRDEPGRHTLWLPVWQGDHAHACLEITQAQPFKRRQRDLITGVCMVYQNYQNLLDYSERDALTGLLNRKTFDEQFSRYRNTAGQAPGLDEPCQWLAVMDIDHFKQVNDRFGHLYGDEVLILVANRLRGMFRTEDRVFRFGGEEFVVLLRSTTLAQARVALERLRTAIALHEFPQVGHITVSVGFAATHGGTPVEVLGNADQALYYAKGHGRNQVRFHGDLVDSGALARKVEHDEVELF